MTLLLLARFLFLGALVALVVALVWFERQPRS